MGRHNRAAAVVDGFAPARSASRTLCQVFRGLFDAAEAPLHDENNRRWKRAVPNAERLAQSICPDCPIAVQCGEGAALEGYYGIAGGGVWHNGRLVGGSLVVDQVSE